MLFWKKKTERPASPTPEPQKEPEKKEEILSIRARTPNPTVTTAKPSQFPRKRGFVSPYLKAIRSALHAETVLFLRPHQESDTFYLDEVSGIRSHVTLPDDLRLPPELQYLLEPRVHQLSSETFAGDDWAYSDAPMFTPVIMVTPVALGDRQGLLIADRKQETTPFSPHETLLFSEMARLLSLVLADNPAQAARTTPRSRRAILLEEMHRARETDTPVTLALLYPRMAREMTEQTPEKLHELETALGRQLAAWFPDVRIERFGELMWGLILQGDPQEISARLHDINRRFSELEGPLSEGVIIGAAQLATTHETPDDWRNDARTALMEAYETGEITYFVEEV